MTVVGVIVRAEADRFEEVCARFEALDGVQMLPLEEPSCVGLVLVADTVKQAHRLLREQVETTPGVLTAWPVQVNLDPVIQDQVIQDPEAAPTTAAQVH